MALSIEQKTIQKISSNTIQLMNMIQMTGIELQEYVEKIAQDNPVFDLDSIPVHEEDFHAPKATNNTPETKPQAFSTPKSLDLEILIQLDALALEPELMRNTRLLAAHLDEHGYLSIEDLKYIESVIGKSKAAKALEVLQSLYPAGIGAKDLSECLCLQLRRLPQDTSLAEKIVSKYLELLSKGHFKQIAKLTGADIADVKACCTLIKSLDPKPCRAYEKTAKTDYIVPDLFLDENNVILLNARQIPKLSLSNYYLRMLQTNTDPDVVEYLNQKFKQAELLISTLQHRSTAILRCAEAIARKQQAFFSTQGQGKIQPLTQAEIAAQTGLSESTVSRVINGKYIQCSFGTYSLASFFSSGLKGEHDVSSVDVKKQLRFLIEEEDKTKPLSDQNIAEILSEYGIDISRRTVAKYRQQLNIPGTLVRKQT